MKQIPRPEYPRPQMVRDAWMNLNGEWDFEFDFGKSGWDRAFYKPENAAKFTKKILVPFCPESKLSGIGYVDFIPAVWYSRTFQVPADWAGKHLLLHFGAADYKTTVWVNGVNVGEHTGGYSSFYFDITKALQDGTNTIVVYCQDDVRSGKQPRGKQCGGYYSAGCDYTRTTGIW